MIRLLRLVGIAAHRNFLQWLAGRGFLVTIVFEQCVTPVLGLAVWSAALPGADDVSTYYLALLMVQLMTVSFEHHTLSNRIYAGSLSHDLLKPQPPVLTTIGENCALRAWHVLIGVPLIAIIWLVTGVAFEVSAVLLAVPAVLLAAVLRFLFTYALALSAFGTQQAHGAVGFGETLIFLLGGSAAPIAFFPGTFQAFGEFLPFRAMLGLPAEIASGTIDREQVLAGYAWQIVWLAAFTAAAVIDWRRGVRRFTAVGG
ncbi:MAG: ABC-2 family transporter protein [Chloroflexota bacterium]|nr:ABC-2 family transporter protein [Chloroflexota bacterium]